MVDLNDIEIQLVDVLKELEDKLILEQRHPNTEEIISIIGDLGHHHDYDVCAGKCSDRFERQWLFDLVWYKENDERNLISVPLVAESELRLGLDDHKVDFEKLLVANAENRLFICQAYTDDVEPRFEYFQKGINLYNKNCVDDNYLIAIFDYYTHKLTYRKLRKLQ